MYRILSASKDTYITNKIIDNKFRATDANVGEAGTLDLFKLYNESSISGESNPIEISKILIKFPIEEITSMDNQKIIDITDPSFKCFLKLHDVYGGQTTPEKFKIILFPLSKNFDEGTGMDIARFSDLDSVNYITSSIHNGDAILWESAGANALGELGDSNIDAIVSGTLDADIGKESLCVEQYFVSGKEDLFLDVTKIVSGTSVGLIENHGFLLSFSGSYEENDKSYFVKRFASRNSKITANKPKLIINFNDSIQDNHSDFIFNVTSSLYLLNYHHNTLSNILSGSAATPLIEDNCMKLKIESESLNFKKIFDVSQNKKGRHYQDGVYKSSFAISSYDDLLYTHVNTSGSLTFNEIWTNAEETVTYLSSSLTIKKENRQLTNSVNQNNLLVSVLNVNDKYNFGEKIKIRVFVENRDRDLVTVKSPLEKKSEIFNNMHYRIKDVNDGKILIDFDTINNSTKLSTDLDGMFFEIFTDSLPKGRLYTFEFLIIRNGVNSIIKDAASNFKIV